MQLPFLVACSSADTTSTTSSDATATSSSTTATSTSSSGAGGGAGELPGYHDDLSGKTAILVNAVGASFACNQEIDGEYLVFFVGGSAAMTYAHHDGSMQTIPADGFQAVLEDITGGTSANKRSSTAGTLTLAGAGTAATLTGTFDVTFGADGTRTGDFTTASCAIDL